LAIAEAIMRLHGGSVSVANANDGVRFELHFPAQKASRERVDSHSSVDATLQNNRQ
jgi:signal transduction histidine kinase